MKINQVLVGHVIDKLKELPEKSVDMVMTSPPYWALRDYGSDPVVWDSEDGCEHEWKTEITKRPNSSGGQGEASKLQIGNKGANFSEYEKRETLSNFCTKCNAWKGELGLEPTFDLYIKHLCDIFDGVKRVLKDEGTIWVNLGDTYSSSGGDKTNGGNLGNKKALLEKKYRTKMIYLSTKSLVLIPFRFAIEMVNRGWILRNTIIWHKRNCMPSSAKDRFTVDFEYLFFFSKKKKYYFETQLEPLKECTITRAKAKTVVSLKSKYDKNDKFTSQVATIDRSRINLQGRNKRTVWTINTKPFKEAHFAVYPEALCETPIKAGCPIYVCKKCGKAKEKIYDVIGKQITENMKIAGCDKEGNYSGKEQKKYKQAKAQEPSKTKKRILESMSQIKKEKCITKCSCNAGFTSGIILDPFFGSGTTGLVALKQGKKFIGIDIKQEYADMAMKRLKPYLEQKSLLEVSQNE